MAAVDSLLEESAHFIEWLAGATTLAEQVILVEMQIQLAFWRRTLPDRFGNPYHRHCISVNARAFSEWVLQISGWSGER